MTKKMVNIREEIIRTLVDIGEPVTFRHLKREGCDRQLVYYHLEKLVSEGIVIAETNGDGERTYRCQSVFYDKEICDFLKSAKASALFISVNRHSIDEDVAKKSLEFILRL